MVVGTALASREDGLVDSGLESTLIFPEEDQTSSGATKSFVSSCGDNITVLEGVVELLGSDQAGGVSNVSHQPGTLGFLALGRRREHGVGGTLGVADVTESAIVPVTRIGRGTANNETRLEDL